MIHREGGPASTPRSGGAGPRAPRRSQPRGPSLVSHQLSVTSLTRSSVMKDSDRSKRLNEGNSGSAPSINHSHCAWCNGCVAKESATTALWWTPRATARLRPLHVVVSASS